jgi:hypothetical protein
MILLPVLIDDRLGRHGRGRCAAGCTLRERPSPPLSTAYVQLCIVSVPYRTVPYVRRIPGDASSLPEQYDRRVPCGLLIWILGIHPVPAFVDSHRFLTGFSPAWPEVALGRRRRRRRCCCRRYSPPAGCFLLQLGRRHVICVLYDTIFILYSTVVRELGMYVWM